jgi:hypothetical protein
VKKIVVEEATRIAAVKAVKIDSILVEEERSCSSELVVFAAHVVPGAVD